MSGTTCGAALLALVSTWGAVAPADTLVIDGDPRDVKTRKFLCVGWDESGQPAVAAVRGHADFAGSMESEAFEVSNLLTCWAGNQRPPAVRAEVFDLFDLFDQALAVNRTLGDTVMHTQTVSYDYLTGSRAEGALAQVRFTVRILSEK